MSALRAYTAVWGLKAEVPTVYHFSVLMLIAHWSWKKGFCFGTQDAICDRLHISERHLQRVLKDLAARKWIDVDRQAKGNGHFGSNHIRLTIGLTGAIDDDDLPYDPDLDARMADAGVQRTQSRKASGLGVASPADSQADQIDGERLDGERLDEPHSPKGAEEPDLLDASLESVDEAVRLWNEMAGANGLPRIKAVSPKRHTSMKKILRAHGMAVWRDALRRVAASSFLCGTQKGYRHIDTENPWQAGFDWLVKPGNLAKVIEGNYREDRRPAGSDARRGEDERMQERIAGDREAQLSIMREWELDPARPWPAYAGPLPGHKGCIIAPDIQASFLSRINAPRTPTVAPNPFVNAMARAGIDDGLSSIL